MRTDTVSDEVAAALKEAGWSGQEKPNSTELIDSIVTDKYRVELFREEMGIGCKIIKDSDVKAVFYDDTIPDALGKARAFLFKVQSK